ncbi:twin-arginine translocase subunit TatC [Candidatus Woesebacteria bacterium]|nr:twin-arginine translocase subunit TatC [Candidatus Woesebacteria bacterium]
MANPPTQTIASRYYPFLLEIRKRFLFVGSLFVIATIVGFFSFQRIVTLVLGFFRLQGVNIVFTTPFQFFTLALNSGLVVGVIVVIPVVIFQLLGFLKPALRQKEYRILVNILPLTLVLFSLGFGYGVLVMKLLLEIFYRTSVSLQIGNVLDIEKFLSNVLLTGLLMGVSFLFPIVMTVLMLLNLVKHSFFERQRVYAYLIAVLFVILLPPPDLISDIVLFTPLVILFELTLILNRIFLKTHLS